MCAIYGCAQVLPISIIVNTEVLPFSIIVNTEVLHEKEFHGETENYSSQKRKQEFGK